VWIPLRADSVLDKEDEVAYEGRLEEYLGDGPVMVVLRHREQINDLDPDDVLGNALAGGPENQYV
ncbi:hypothetical protein ACV34H_33860, partial [Pseudomonas aeruginosa]